MKSKMKPMLDRQLSHVDWTPEDSRSVLRQIRGEIKVKKKLSLALVLALAIILLSASALAVTLWKQYYEKMAQTEGEVGYFDTWSGERRAEFVLAMQEEGVEFDKQQIDRLTDRNTGDADKAKIAADLILQEYPGMREDTITAISILEAEKGPLPTWSAEDKAAYTQMLVKTGTLGDDEEMYWLPGKDDIPEEKAVAIAQEAILQKFGAAEKDLKSLTLYAELRSTADQKDDRKWLVHYMKPQADVYGDPSEYSVWIDARTGKTLSCDAPAQNVPSSGMPKHIEALWQQAFLAYMHAEPYTMESLIQLKNDWAERFVELKKHTTRWVGFTRAIRNIAEQDIRMPEEGSIPLSEAWTRAENAVLALPGWTREKLSWLARFAEVYYDSNELGKPVYHLFFSHKSGFWPEFRDRPFEEYEKNYADPCQAAFGNDFHQTPRYVAVRLDARTGELTEPPLVVLPMEGDETKALELIR